MTEGFTVYVKEILLPCCSLSLSTSVSIKNMHWPIRSVVFKRFSNTYCDSVPLKMVQIFKKGVYLIARCWQIRMLTYFCFFRHLQRTIILITKAIKQPTHVPSWKPTYCILPARRWPLWVCRWEVMKYTLLGVINRVFLDTWCYILKFLSLLLWITKIQWRIPPDGHQDRSKQCQYR